MIVDGVWMGETISVNPYELPKANRDLDENEIHTYFEWSISREKMKWDVPSIFVEPVLIEMGGKRGMISTCIIANKTPITKW